MNLNVSQQPKPAEPPARRNQPGNRNLPPAFRLSGETWLNGLVSISVLTTAIMGSLYVASGEKLPELDKVLSAERNQEVQSQKSGEQRTAQVTEVQEETLQSTLEASLKKYDAIRSRKEFPEQLVDPGYQLYEPSGIGTTRSEVKEQFLRRYRNATSVGYFTKLDGVVFLADRAYVQCTTKIRVKAPVKSYVSPFHSETTDENGEAPANSIRYERVGGVWNRATTENGTEDGWTVEFEYPIETIGPYVTEDADSSVTYGEDWPASLSTAKELIGARLTALDIERGSKEFGVSAGLVSPNFLLDVDNDGEFELSRATAEWRFKKALSAIDGIEIESTLNESVQYTARRIIAIVDRRYTWRNRSTGALVTAGRQEVDFWRRDEGVNGEEWVLVQTRFLTHSPTLSFAGL